MFGRVMSSLGADMKIKYPSVKCEQQPRPERADLPWPPSGGIKQEILPSPPLLRQQ